MSEPIDEQDLRDLRRELEDQIEDVKESITTSNQALAVIGIDVERLQQVREFQREVVEGLRVVVWALAEAHASREPTHLVGIHDEKKRKLLSCYYKDKYCPTCGMVVGNINLVENAQPYLRT